ncbi:MAG: F0F1 ATP synthase subunit B [Gracilimonas sp.]|uniref:F0F1 ATP synthase subunit B n=1 Tax=Gracilimonas TaxID=649462 RepID=UPI001B219B52|nr:F0F1 ATP synthase subunit B [Gracilimonas sp.]MBO6586687.1 F0F1 ATP synthase subunit B [Gracilimonas sp.]MBO6615344.1 F0F1 ATP synthase subunit B [Gracilimonas sp.]
MTLLLAGGSFLSFNTGFALWILISMIVFVWVMTKYAVPPIMTALQERERNIKESLESAENALAKAEKISKDNEKALREAEVKAQQIRKEAVEEAELIRAERIKKAKEDADQLIEQARTSIEQEKKQALVELRKEVAKLAVESASIIIDAELDSEKNNKLVDNFLSNLPKN